MKLPGIAWRTLTADVAVGGRKFRVVRPAQPPKHAPLSTGYRSHQMLVDKPSAIDLAAAWWLAARSPRTVVWLPLRQTATSCGSCYGRRLDLVLMHHSLGLPVAAWKQARAQVRQPRPHTAVLPERPFPDLSEADYEESRWREKHDHLRFATAADTLFLIGSRTAFELQADQLRGLVEDCPAHMAASPGTHCCAEIGIGATPSASSDKNRRNAWGELHVEYCADHR
ncbi:hypothetical protein [Promicromonospora iranensis]|uniref:Uncharacterized protein n=1 Tax=Promicromonospora iranensis TaxID=1105144 RepID=A0ABU2CSS3_9MICO|nr:hypothetical protein [Promicromonospora iranensis]MDR7384388.1 hypothetical protein [Promicromonospora iranensis]